MTPPVPSSVSKPASENPNLSPTSPNTLTYWTPSRLEIRAGGRAGIGDRFQLETGADFRFTPRLCAGAGIQTDFQHKASFFLEGGLRFSPSHIISIQPTFLLGIGRLFDYASQSGFLKENVLLNGLIVTVNPEVRFQVHLTPKWGFYIAPGYTFEARGKTESEPRRLMTGDSPHPNAHIVGVNFGVLFGPFGKKIQKVKTVIPPPESPPPPVKPSPPKVEKEIPKAPPAPEPEEKIIAQVAEIKKDLPVDQAMKLDREIGKIRQRLLGLKNQLQYVREGINRTNQMVRRFTETSYDLIRDPALKISTQNPLRTELKALQAATVLNSDRKPISLTETSEQIRNGLRVIYPASKGNTLYGERIVFRLDRLAAQLKGRQNAALTTEIRRTTASVRKYLKEFATPIKIGDLQQDVKIIAESMKGLEPLAKELNLTDKPQWKSLRDDLSSFEEALMLKTREAEIFSLFVTAINGPQNDFLDQVSHPIKAKAAFENALRFMGDLSRNQNRLKVSFEDVKKTYSDFFGLLELNLDTFIFRHVPPEEKRPGQRRPWLDSVLKSQELLCAIRPDHPRCKEKFERVEGPASGKKIQATKTVKPGPTRTVARPTQAPRVASIPVPPSATPPPPPDPGLK